jgi:hypothetical protein
MKSHLGWNTSETKPSQTEDSNEKKHITEKQFVLRPRMSIADSLVKGITWCDFLGIFICVIDH